MSCKNKETFFISHITTSPFQGDDGAYIDGYLYSQDAFFENVHFKTSWLTYKQIAIKASLVNISDCIAMNGNPKYALLSIALPKTVTKQQIKQLTEGFLECAKKYNYEIIGGDTIANKKLDISITFISETKKPIFRDSLKKGEYLAFTGDLGSVKKDLKKLFRGQKINKTSKFITPQIRDKFMFKASRYITSAIDISDGLFKELERLSQLNKVSYKFLKSFKKSIGCSGEEYELLFSFKKEHLKYIQNIAKLTKTPVTIFGVAKRGKFKSICKENHF
jgi:thiamine-monophosphate kinase